jgi:hypothetical protein
VTVEPETVQTPVVAELNATLNPDDEVALTANGASPNTLPLSAPKVIVCVPWVIVKDCGTWAAAAIVELPA